MNKSNKLNKFWQVVIVTTATVLLLVLSVYLLFFFSIKQQWTSVEKHIECITNKVQKRYEEYGSFRVSPVEIINKKSDDISIFIVEFDSGYFIFILARSTNLYNVIGKSILDLNLTYAQYAVDNGLFESGWQRYRVNLSKYKEVVYADGSYWKPMKGGYSDSFYECDENGKFIHLHESPYKLAGINSAEEPLYCIRNEASGFIPVKKNGDTIQSLVSSEIISIEQLYDAFSMHGIIHFYKNNSL